MRVTMKGAKSIEVVWNGRPRGRADLTAFTIAGYDEGATRYAVSGDEDTAREFGVEPGEMLGYITRLKSRWAVTGCHDLEDAVSYEMRETPTYLPDARSLSEGVVMLAKLRHAERHPDAPKDKLRAAAWAGIRIPEEWFAEVN